MIAKSGQCGDNCCQSRATRIMSKLVGDSLHVDCTLGPPCLSLSSTMAQQSTSPESDRIMVQIASYNTNLQGILGLPQDLVDWLAPTLQVSSFLVNDRRAPDIVAVGFQELLPLHLGRQYTRNWSFTVSSRCSFFLYSFWIFTVCNRRPRRFDQIPN